MKDRYRQPRERPGRNASGECSIGRVGDGAGLIGRPERIGVQALAEALVPGNGCFDQFPSARPPVAQSPRDVDQRTRERIAGLLRVANLDSLFEIYGSVAEALEAIRRKAQGTDVH